MAHGAARIFGLMAAALLASCDDSPAPVLQSVRVQLATGEAVTAVSSCEGWDIEGEAPRIAERLSAAVARADREDASKTRAVAPLTISFEPMGNAGEYRSPSAFAARCGEIAVVKHEMGHIWVARSGDFGPCFRCVWHDGDPETCPDGSFEVDCDFVPRD